MDKLITYTNKYAQLFPSLNERSRRLVVASDAEILGYGGVTLLHQASGLDYKTIKTGIKELKEQELDNILPPERCRRPGAGRKKITETDKTVEADLLSLVADTTRGDPESLLQWSIKSTRAIADNLKAKGHQISHTTAMQILKDNDFRLQANSKTKEGRDNPDRDKQFHYINNIAKRYLSANDPVISVDTKKKELIGNYKNNGRNWLPKGEPLEVNGHDFPNKEKGKAVPYGIYDLKNNQGYVNVGINHDTSEFAVNSIKRWWTYLGKKKFLNSKRILITADSGGSNGYRLRLWKKELQELADGTGLEINVTHFPPGTSKWNKIEHRLFSFISTNWQGRPLTDYETIINLISATKTKTGLKVYAVLDKRKYKLKKKVTDEKMAAIKLEPHEFHGEWNYAIKPKINNDR